MIRVLCEGHEPFALQIVDDPLHVLAIGTQIAGEPRNGLGTLGRNNDSKHLPPRTRQPKRQAERLWNFGAPGIGKARAGQQAFVSQRLEEGNQIGLFLLR